MFAPRIINIKPNIYFFFKLLPFVDGIVKYRRIDHKHKMSLQYQLSLPLGEDQQVPVCSYRPLVADRWHCSRIKPISVFAHSYCLREHSVHKRRRKKPPCDHKTITGRQRSFASTVSRWLPVIRFGGETMFTVAVKSRTPYRN